MKNLLLIISFFVLTSGGPPMGPPGGPPRPPCWVKPCTVPIDGGLSLLILAAVGLGSKKIYELKQKK
jgi:hypothetical protein